MGGTIAFGNGQLSGTYCYDRVADGSDRLQIAVFWRHLRDPDSARYPLVDAVRALFGRRRPPSPPHFPPELKADRWAGSIGGRREVRLDRGARILRVLGTDYPVPDDATLVLLVDDRAGDPTVTTRVVTTPHEPASGLDPSLDRAKNLARLRADATRERGAWLLALREDDAVRVFLDAR